MTEAVSGNDRIFSILFNEDEVTWQSMIYNLVKTDEIDPWDVDVSDLSTKFLDLLSKLKEMDFRISGKVLLAAAVLLKIKSNKFLGTDISNFENMFKVQDEEFGDLEDFVYDDNLDHELMMLEKEKRDKKQLIPRTPQPRERKVSIFDLVDALQRALDVRERKVVRSKPQKNNFKVPERARDITQIIRDVFSNVKTYFLNNNNSEVMKFNELLPTEEKDDKIFTFLSLLHLTNERKVDMLQEKHRSPIYVKMLQK
ncbi:segregation/condensation protein A [Candidatus Woesearchaeota archaeon]|nr:segregation/condensation protein A [Candidatus Woesearchaeota archaeon]